GSPTGAPSASAEIFDPTTNTFTATGSLNKDRASHTATLLPNGNVLITGGNSNAGGGIVFSTEIYNPASRTFTVRARAEWPWTTRGLHSAALVANGKVRATGALTSGLTPTKKAEIYDPGTGSSSPAGDMSIGRIRHWATATNLPGDKVMVVGG